MKIAYYYPNIVFESLSNLTIRLMGDILSKQFSDIEFLPLTFYNELNISNYFTESFYKYKAISEKLRTKTGRVFDLYLSNLLIFDSEIVDKKVVEQVSNDTIIIMTITSIFQVNHLLYLLEKGYKIVVGGPAVNALGVSFIRSIISKINDNLNKNVIFVTGFADRSTNFKKIIDDWKDVDIGTSSELFNLDEEDVYFDLLNEEQKQILYRSIPVFTFNGCYWGKCKHCTPFDSKYRKWERMYQDSNNLIEYINFLLEKYSKYCNSTISINTDHIDNETIEQVLLNEKLQATSLNYFMTGVKYLKNPKSFENLIKIVNRYGLKDRFYFLAAIESFSDYSLSRLNRGYSLDDVLEFLSKIRLIYDICKDMWLEITMIHDLPILDEQETKFGIEACYRLKDEFPNSFIYHFNYLRLIETNVKGLAYISNHEEIKDEFKCGHVPFIQEVITPEIVEENYLIRYDVFKTFVRFDYNGKLIKSDRYLVHELCDFIE